MKHKKTIKIKDPQLRRLRNNLRLVFIRFALDQKSRLREELKNVWWDKNGNSAEYNETNVGVSRRPVRKMYEIDKILDKSICLCPVCQKSDQDMIFNPVTKVWFCVDCYELNREYYRHTKDSKFYP